MPLDNSRKKTLKAEAHHLKPIVRIGSKGLTAGVVQETGQALDSHPLLKVHIALDDREERRETAAQLAKATRSEIVSQIGKTCTLYRQKDPDA
ncbi:MAG TPA: ribosome assembly RNA-binding protein YhbY [Mariprofundaceae bacterium]|nr:ribosome assembly RNA-binding protein YhbY [Mariprofundaceae bacterium]